MTADEMRALFETERRDGFAPGPSSRIVSRFGLTMALGQNIFVSDWPRDQALAKEALARLLGSDLVTKRIVYWRIYEGDDPEELSQALAHSGFEADEPGTLMGLDLSVADILAPHDIEVRRVTTLEELDASEDVMSRAFDYVRQPSTQEWQNAKLTSEDTFTYLALIDGVPVGCGFLDHVEGAANCHLRAGGVTPDYRRRGVYSALVRSRLQDAGARGAQIACTDARETSRPPLEKMGFRRLCKETTWVRNIQNESVN